MYSDGQASENLITSNNDYAKSNMFSTQEVKRYNTVIVRRFKIKGNIYQSSLDLYLNEITIILS